MTGGRGSGQSLDVEQLFAPFARKMQREEVPQLVVDQFRGYLQELLSSRRSIGIMPEESISPLGEDDLPAQSELGEEHAEAGKALLQEAVMIKLNGGLGTSMGMPHAKSLLTVRSGYTFLDLIRLQAEKDGLPLLLMDSFNTREDVAAYWERRGVPPQKQPESFVQNKFPKILRESMEPANWPDRPDLEWNPPGHGDIYSALQTSGILERLIREGRRYAFISNADNLGAVVDPAILGFMAQKQCMFLMEVARRSGQDKKGGHLALSGEGKLLLREAAQCPDSELECFQDVERHRFFNTNNVWIDLVRLRDFISQNGLPQLPLIVNPKSLDPRDESTPAVYQLETAMGAAISTFPDSLALQVSRDRFLPVKKTNDLLVLRSDCYILNEHFRLLPNPERDRPQVLVDLDPRYYKLVDDFEARFPHGPPSLLQCDSLKVSGDVLFGKDVSCHEHVEVINESGRQRRIADGDTLRGKVVLS